MLQRQEEQGQWGLGQPGQRPAPDTASLAQGRAMRQLHPSFTVSATIPSPQAWVINKLMRLRPC